MGGGSSIPLPSEVDDALDIVEDGAQAAGEWTGEALGFTEENTPENSPINWASGGLNDLLNPDEDEIKQSCEDSIVKIPTGGSKFNNDSSTRMGICNLKEYVKNSEGEITSESIIENLPFYPIFFDKYFK